MGFRMKFDPVTPVIAPPAIGTTGWRNTSASIVATRYPWGPRRGRRPSRPACWWYSIHAHQSSIFHHGLATPPLPGTPQTDYDA